MQEQFTDSSVTPLRSMFADDEIIADILPAFVQNMPRYVGNLRAAIDSRDWPAGARICHDLKGTAGGYGYPQIGRLAQLLEDELKSGQQLPVIERYLADTDRLCHLAVLGLGQPAGSQHF